MTTTETDTHSLLGRILGSREAEEFLAWPGDFEPSRSGQCEAIRLPSGTPLQAVAGDGNGGTYYQAGAGAGAGRPVLYVSSEGEGGLIAASLPEALELLIGLPYWQDCLPGRDFPVAELEAEYGSTFPDLDERRDRVTTLLGLSRPDTPELLRRLHTSLSRTTPTTSPWAPTETPTPP